jgi:hypothetical protein
VNFLFFVVPWEEVSSSVVSLGGGGGAVTRRRLGASMAGMGRPWRRAKEDEEEEGPMVSALRCTFCTMEGACGAEGGR